MHQTALIVDDDPTTRQALGAALASAGIANLIAEDVPAMWSLLETRPDLLIFGLGMADTELLALLGQLRRKSEIPVLIHASGCDELKQLAGDTIAALDFLARPCDKNELLARIGHLLRPSPEQPAPLPCSEMRCLRFGQWTLDTAARQLIGPDGTPTPLGVPAYALLCAFLDHPFEPQSREQLSRALKREYLPYDRIIDVHVSQIRRILGKQQNGSAFIKTLRSEGYVFIAAVDAG
ncbi:winged helix-turn-helix domain-containing protein [Dechloromonas sp. A34]|uniref:winged helix-turn-helix domain-containing protein n=1 Tax=Dechloromonas sp. A34 TaxID=447588 RepID=UPI0022493727|nr:response regulator transcription factor [Dechloromonas sp. A34]